jgi:hypothetical protein
MHIFLFLSVSTPPFAESAVLNEDIKKQKTQFRQSLTLRVWVDGRFSEESRARGSKQAGECWANEHITHILTAPRNRMKWFYYLTSCSALARSLQSWFYASPCFAYSNAIYQAISRGYARHFESRRWNQPWNEHCEAWVCQASEIKLRLMWKSDNHVIGDNDSRSWAARRHEEWSLADIIVERILFERFNHLRSPSRCFNDLRAEALQQAGWFRQLSPQQFTPRRIIRKSKSSD